MTDTVNKELLTDTARLLEQFADDKSRLTYFPVGRLREIATALRAVPSPGTVGVRSAMPSFPFKQWADKIENTTRLKQVQETTSYHSAMYVAVIECFYDFEAKRLVQLLRTLATLSPTHCTAGRREKIARIIAKHVRDDYTWFNDAADAILALTSEQSGPTAGRHDPTTGPCPSCGFHIKPPRKAVPLQIEDDSPPDRQQDQEPK